MMYVVQRVHPFQRVPPRPLPPLLFLPAEKSWISQSPLWNLSYREFCVFDGWNCQGWNYVLNMKYFLQSSVFFFSWVNFVLIWFGLFSDFWWTFLSFLLFIWFHLIWWHNLIPSNVELRAVFLWCVLCMRRRAYSYIIFWLNINGVNFFFGMCIFASDTNKNIWKLWNIKVCMSVVFHVALQIFQKPVQMWHLLSFWTM